MVQNAIKISMNVIVTLVRMEQLALTAITHLAVNVTICMKANYAKKKLYSALIINASIQYKYRCIYIMTCSFSYYR